MMIEELEKQKRKVQQAIETVKILGDLKSRYDLSLEFQRILKMTNLSETEIMNFRQRYKLVSGVWDLAELEIIKEEKLND